MACLRMAKCGEKGENAERAGEVVFDDDDGPLVEAGRDFEAALA